MQWRERNGKNIPKQMETVIKTGVVLYVGLRFEFMLGQLKIFVCGSPHLAATPTSISPASAQASCSLLRIGDAR